MSADVLRVFRNGRLLITVPEPWHKKISGKFFCTTGQDIKICYNLIAVYFELRVCYAQRLAANQAEDE